MPATTNSVDFLPHVALLLRHYHVFFSCRILVHPPRPVALSTSPAGTERSTTARWCQCHHFSRRKTFICSVFKPDESHLFTPKNTPQNAVKRLHEFDFERKHFVLFPLFSVLFSLARPRLKKCMRNFTFWHSALNNQNFTHFC